MFGNLFNRNSGDKKANNFEKITQLVRSNPDLFEKLKNILEPKKEEIKEIFIPNYLTPEEIDNLPNITDWEELVDMKSRTNWVNSPYKDDIILQRMVELLPNQLANIWETTEDVEILLRMNHELSYKSEFNRSIKNKLLTFLPNLLTQIDDLNKLSSWYDRVGFLDLWDRNSTELEDIVKNRLKDIIWAMSWSERLKAKEGLTKFPNIIDNLIDERELEIILQEWERNTLYKNRDSKRILKRTQSEKIAQWIYDIISNKTIQFTQKDISNIFKQMEQNSTIISQEITDALLNYFSDINNNH